MEFSQQEYWSGLPLPSPGDLSKPGIKPRSLALQADSLTSEPPGKSPGASLFLVSFFKSAVNFPAAPGRLSLSPIGTVACWVASGLSNPGVAN